VSADWAVRCRASSCLSCPWTLFAPYGKSNRPIRPKPSFEPNNKTEI